MSQLGTKFYAKLSTLMGHYGSYSVFSTTNFESKNPYHNFRIQQIHTSHEARIYVVLIPTEINSIIFALILF